MEVGGQVSRRLADRGHCATRYSRLWQKIAPEGRQNVARGQSDEGAATPGEEVPNFPQAPEGRQKFLPPRWGLEIFLFPNPGSPLRSDPGYNLWAPPGPFLLPQLYQEFGEPSHLARLSWLEGRITRDLGLWDGAELKCLEAEMVPIFASRDVHPEALAALALRSPSRPIPAR